MELILSYPSWFILFCLALGVAYAALLYFKSDHFNTDQAQSAWIKRGLAVFRFLSASSLAFLLLSPFVKSKQLDKIDPVIVYMHDNSESILLGLSSEDSANYIESTNVMLSKLSEKYQVDYYTFDEDIQEIDTLNFKGKSSNLSQALSQINGLYFNQNVGAVLFASDGIYNQGSNPSYTEFGFPLYTIALGDTNQQTDVKIVAARHNKLAYLDDEIQLEVDLQANHLEGKAYQLDLLKNGSKLGSKNIAIQKDFDEQTTQFTIKANAIGIQKYSLQLQAFDDEVSLVNNSYDFYIEVIDNRQKILLVANAPHPDIAAIKSVVEVNKNFELKVEYANRFQGELDPYSLVIVHQLPSKNQGAKNVFTSLKNTKIPTWYITGSSSSYNLFNQEQSLIQIEDVPQNTNDAIPYFNPGFSSFSLSESTINQLRKFPPVSSPFGNYKPSSSTNAVLKQKIGTVETDFPLLAIQDNFGTRSAIFIGDGLWRWKLHDYLESGSNEAFNEIIEKTINYLALKGDKRKFRVSTNKNAYFEGERVQFEAELYNDNYELINEPEATLLVKHEDGQEFPFSFSKTSNAYTYETNSLPIGNYSYTAKTSYQGKSLEANGAFSITAMQLEALQTKADHGVLKKLAQQSNGRFVAMDELEKLSEELLNDEGIKPMIYESFKTRSIINLFGIFFVIMTLLSIEWFARKWFGAY